MAPRRCIEEFVGSGLVLLADVASYHGPHSEEVADHLHISFTF